LVRGTSYCRRCLGSQAARIQSLRRRLLTPPADPSRTRPGTHHEPASRLTTVAAVLAWSLPG
jgi:hypothetical protein